MGFQWVDASSGSALSAALGFATLATSQQSSVPLSIIYTPNTNQTIAVRNVSGQYATVMANYSWATIVQINQAFSLNTLSTMTITGNVSVGGNLTVTGNIVGNVYSSPDSAVSTFMFLGTWTTVQNGESLYMRLISHAGYNAVANQNQVTELMFATANGSSYVSGSTGNYYANGLASVNSRLGTGGSPTTYQAPVKFRIVQVSLTSYQIYVYYGANYMGHANYSVQIGPATTWTDSSTVVSTPGGNYLEITPTAF
jgi:hypothetical protein